MSQKLPADSGQKHFTVGRGLLAAAETLNFNINDQRSSRQMGGMVSSVGSGDVEVKDSSSQMPRHGSGSNLGSTMKLFASLGLSPSDLDALAKIPEEEISVETLPHILMQLKNRKGDVVERRGASSDAGYREARSDWDDVHVGRFGNPSLGQSSARAQSSADFGYSSLQDTSSGRGYSLNYSSGGSRERPYSELSHHSSYSGLSMEPSSCNPVFMQRRMGSPSNGKVQDFLGVMPSMFPHVCALCDFDVYSSMEWNQHVNGLRHAGNRRLLLNMYPDWDPGMAPGRGGGLLDTPNLSAGLLGPAPFSSSQTSGMSSTWGEAPRLSGNGQSGQNKLRSRVVVAKYDKKPLSNKTLFVHTEPFGVLREHLVLKNKAFLEMSSHEEAVDMVNYYEQHPAYLYGKPLKFYLSKRLMVIEKDERLSDGLMDRPAREVKGHGSQVVFFCNLPRDDEKKEELLIISRRFGVVEKHLFLTDQAFVQMETPEDAEMLVKYYSANPLTIKGRHIRLNICTKYKTLNVNRRQGGASGDNWNQRSSGANSSSSSYSTRTFTSSRTSSSSSRTREDKKKEEKPTADEEEVSGVMEGEDEEDKGEVEHVEKAEDETVSEDVTVQQEDEEVKEEEEERDKEDPDGGNTTDAPAEVGGAVDEAQQEAASETRETEASTREHENKDKQSAETPENEGDLPSDLFEQGFLENMDDFVTLDEVAEDEDIEESDSTDHTKKGGKRVVNIVGFRRGYNYLNELLGLAKPFGKVVKHLVLDLRPEAYLQFATEEEAQAMAKFYNSNVTASVCGRPVRVSHSMTYPTIQCGSSRVVYIGQIPSSKYSDEAVLKLAEPFGKVRKYFLNRIKRECFIEMEKAEDAEKMAESCKADPPKFNGKRLTVYVSRKYRQLKHAHRFPSTMKRERSRSPTKEPATKKPKEKMAEKEVEEEKAREEEKLNSDLSGEEKTEENPSEKITEVREQNQLEKREEELEEMETTNHSEQTQAAQNKPVAASLPLPPYDPEIPIGVEHVKMGYYCRVCFLFYSNEGTAKKTHCSSKTHYDKLQNYLEKERNKSEKKVKKAP
ncbi:matrin 3-like 1.2 [Betta splendens]|uniref:Matrin 3-like 1.2 n=1 Tax=Betta splendens TaxID=158456 RepID=A0A6P7NJX6_BETSP|nr:matrin 3-like 1.2 [Betta splendens]